MEKVVALVQATVWYTCELSEENSKKAIEYAEENDLTLEDAIMELYHNADNFSIYENSVESDFSTESIDKAWTEEEDEE